MWSKEEVQQKLRQKAIRDLWYDAEKHGDEADHVMKLYERDRQRFENAQERGKFLRPNNGWLQLQQNGSYETGWNLHPIICSELIDLMSFLTPWAFYDFAGQFNLDGKHIPPFCGTPEFWHSTRQEEWILFEAFSSDDEEHRKLFAAIGDAQR